MKKTLSFIFLIFMFLQTSQFLAQEVSLSNLASVDVNSLSDADIEKIRVQLVENNLTIEQAEPMALAKGMSVIEFGKLKDRLAEPSKVVAPPPVDNKVASAPVDNMSRVKKEVINHIVKDTLGTPVFGEDLFDKPSLNFEPNLRLATPLNYILGVDDELEINVYGVQELGLSATVSVEGKIKIKNVGQIAVLGMTVEAATHKIRNELARIYSTISSGQSKVSVSLSKIRTIRITLIGSKLPGNFSISSLGTVYNALFLGGGPAKNGSYRNIELIRNHKVYKIIDLYRFLVNGDQSDNVGLMNGDVIRIPTYGQRITIDGEVKRPGIFELKKGETFSDLLAFASGFTDVAFKASVNVIQKTDKEFRVRDLTSAEYGRYKPNSGDVFRVNKILNRFENRIQIKGAVFRPDVYSFHEGMRISELIAKANGLREDAYTARATILRLKEDFTKESVSVNLAKVLEGDLESDITLRREDKITIFSKLDFKELYKVTIDGEIKKPGEYDFHENLTLNELLLKAGGLKGSASKYVEIARMIKSEEIDKTDFVKAELFNIEITAENNEQAQNFILAPFDVVNIRRMGMYEKPKTVEVSGAVNYAGKYVLTNKKERIYSVLQRAGGLTFFADIQGVKIKRPLQSKQIEQIEQVDFNVANKSEVTNSDKLAKKLKEELKYIVVPIDWKTIVKNPENRANIILQPGDEIEVSAINDVVKVTGSVLLSSEIPYKRGKGLGYYFSSVGGVDAKGWKNKAYIIYPNGKAAITRSFLFFHWRPKVLPGSQIVVPERPVSKKMSVGEIASIASVLSSLTLLFLTAFK